MKYGQTMMAATDFQKEVPGGVPVRDAGSGSGREIVRSWCEKSRAPRDSSRLFPSECSWRGVCESGTGMMQVDASTARAGFWSGLLATLFSVTYIIAQLAEWAGWLGSAGGPSSSSTPLGIVLLLTPSILLGPSFLVLMVSLHRAAPAEGRVWSQAAVSFATAYMVLVGVVYFVQLTFVAPRITAGRTEGIELLLFTPFDSFFYAVDILGYSFMSIATAFAALALTDEPLERRIRAALIANGLILPFLVFQLFVPSLIWVASAWAITFPLSTVLLTMYFRRGLERHEPSGVKIPGRLTAGPRPRYTAAPQRVMPRRGQTVR